MVSLTMAHADATISNDISESITKTKKSLRLSKKKELILNKKTDKLQKEEKEEQKKNENEKKEKEEDNNTTELEEYDTESKGKQRRHWESWAKADKDLFFEAVSEYGKDFDKICSFMNRKAKARGKECEPRNKDQIRYFYYRTWKRISKAVDLQPSESKRIHHEIYCMICYGELRRKCCEGSKRLDELVRTGSTIVKQKGRKIRIKPPACRFLKKLSEDEEKSAREQEAIPEHIDVELFPRTNREWIMAQKLALNPRIRLNGLPMTLKVKSLMKLLLRRFDGGNDASASEESVVKLYPPKAIFTAENSLDSPLRMSRVQVTVEESSFSTVAKSPRNSKDLNPLPLDSVENCLYTNSENKASVIDASPVQTPFSHDSGNHPGTVPITPSMAQSPDNCRRLLLLESPNSATPPSCSRLTRSVPRTSPSHASILPFSSVEQSPASLSTANSLVGTDIFSAHQSNARRSVSAVCTSILGASDLPVVSASLVDGIITSMPPLAQTASVSARQAMSTTIKGSMLGGIATDRSVSSNNIQVSESILPAIASNNFTSPNGQDKGYEGNLASSVSNFDGTTNRTQISPVKNSKAPVLLRSTHTTSFAAGSSGIFHASSSSNVAPTEVDRLQAECSPKPTGDGGENSRTEISIFPVTHENCTEKDLQACYLALNRPDLIRLEYEIESNEDASKRPSVRSFNKLILLAQRDLRKTLKVATQQLKASANSKTSQSLPRPAKTAKEKKSVKPVHITSTSAEPQRVPSIIKPVITIANSLMPSVSLVPSLKNVIQPKVVSRLRPIQPAAKTLMAKAIAVNIIPQPAHLAQFAQMPAVSAQLINSGSSSLSTVNLAVSSTPSSIAVTSSTFSMPSTPSISSQLTIWSSSRSAPNTSPGAQVEVLQEGGRRKACPKRLLPTTVISAEKPMKLQRLEPSSVEKEAGDISDIDLSFLGGDDDTKSKEGGGHGTSDSINLSSILSGLTKNLCQTDANEQELFAPKSTNSPGTAHPIPMVTTPPREQPAPEATCDKDAAGFSVTSKTCSSVLTTPIKCTAKTPSKDDASLESFKIQPVSFDSQWCGGEMTDISIGGILDVGNLKDGTKSSDSSQASEISIASLLNVQDNKKGGEASLSPCQVTDVSLGALLDAKDDDGKEKCQSNDVSIGKLFGDVQRGESSKTQMPLALVEPPKSCNSDSLLMKPDTDPVTVFESLMNENSVDYIRKFKDLTAKVKAEEASSKAHLFAIDDDATDESLKIANSSTSLSVKDARLPICTSEDSVGPLDGLSFVLPTNDASSTDFT